MSQQEVGDAVGVKQKVVSKWEVGEDTPKPHHIIALAKHFDVTTDYLLGVTEQEREASSVRNYPNLKELLAAAVDEGRAAELIEFIANRMKRQ